MAKRIQFRRDTTANWASENPILASGEIGYETDVALQIKIGDGVTAWNALASYNAPTATLAASATRLATARNINGVAFDGTANITVTAAADTLSGTALAANVVQSSLTALGTITTGVWHGSQIADAYLATISTAGKVANAATTAASANTASAIVARDASGDFTARNITATLFNGPATTANEVAVANVTGLLSGGKILSSLLPSIAITDTSVVGSQAAMLALTAQTGDLAVRSDLNKSFILAGSDPTILGNWQELLTPTDAVLSVAGRTGAVTLISSDITDATSTNTASRVVIRDGSGGFAAGAVTLSGALTYGGVALLNAVTGTGNMVLSASPTFTGTAALAGATFTTKLTSTTSASGASLAATQFTGFASTANGAVIQGFGTTYDASLMGRAGNVAFGVKANSLDVKTVADFQFNDGFGVLTAAGARWLYHNASDGAHIGAALTTTGQITPGGNIYWAGYGSSIGVSGGTSMLFAGGTGNLDVTLASSQFRLILGGGGTVFSVDSGTGNITQASGTASLQAVTATTITTTSVIKGPEFDITDGASVRGTITLDGSYTWQFSTNAIANAMRLTGASNPTLYTGAFVASGPIVTNAANLAVLDFNTTARYTALGTNGATNGIASIETARSDGSNRTVVALFNAGIQVGGPTGGDKGVGSINLAADIYKNNTAYTNPDYVFELFFSGKIKRYANRDGAKGYKLMSLSQVEKYAKKHWHLPGVPDAKGLFERGDVALEKIEELFIHAFDHERRITTIEKTLAKAA